MSVTQLSDKTKFILTLFAFAVLLTGVLSGLYLKRTSDSLHEQFRERAEFRAQVFAELTARHLASDDLNELLSTIFISTDVLYAQVVHNGQVRVARERVPAPSIEPVEGFLQVRESRTSQGQAYLDISYTLSGAASSSYVRLGLSRAPLEQELQGEIFMVAFIAVVALILAGLIIWLLAKLFFPSPTVQPPAAGTSSGAAGETEMAEPVSSGLCIDDVSKRVFLNGVEVKLSPKEYELLRLLASEPGRVFSNEEILKNVWAGSRWATAQDVKQYVYFLRKKLEADPENPKFIITVRGFGYKLNPDTKF